MKVSGSVVPPLPMNGGYNYWPHEESTIQSQACRTRWKCQSPSAAIAKVVGMEANVGTWCGYERRIPRSSLLTVVAKRRRYSEGVVP
jgi:hypothetical protein